MAEPYGGGGGLLGGGFLGFSPLTNFGLGLLAQSGPSLTPQSPWSAIGRAGQYASAAQQQAMENQLYREKLAEVQRARESETALVNAIGTEGTGFPLPEGMTPTAAAALFRANPDAASKAYFNYLFPEDEKLSAADRIALQGAAEANIAKRAENAASESDLGVVFENAYLARDAVRYLKSIPGGASLLVAPDVVKKVLRQAQAAGALDVGTVPGEVASSLSRVPKDQWGNVLNALEQVDKSRSNVATMSQSSNRSVLGLQTRMTGLAQGAGADIQELQFDLTTTAAEKMAAASGWALPDISERQIPWRQGQEAAPLSAPPGTEEGAAAASAALGAGSVGYQNGRLVPQPAPVYSPLPPPPPSPPVIKGVKTSEFGISPMTGNTVPKYRNPAAAEKALVELRRKGIKEVIVVDPATGIEYPLGVE
jgi:hypothetical protein